MNYHLALKLQEDLDELQHLDKDFPPKSSFKRPLMIIVDRSFDLMSPILHEFTYQCMMNDLLVLENGKYVLVIFHMPIRIIIIIISLND